MHSYGGAVIPFYERQSYKLNVLVKKENQNYVKFTNVSNLDMTIFYLSKQGYGSIKEIRELGTDDFLNLVEYEQICSDIESYQMQNARNN